MTTRMHMYPVPGLPCCSPSLPGLHLAHTYTDLSGPRYSQSQRAPQPILDSPGQRGDARTDYLQRLSHDPEHTMSISPTATLDPGQPLWSGTKRRSSGPLDLPRPPDPAIVGALCPPPRSASRKTPLAALKSPERISSQDPPRQRQTHRLPLPGQS